MNRQGIKIACFIMKSNAEHFAGCSQQYVYADNRQLLKKIEVPPPPGNLQFTKGAKPDSLVTRFAKWWLKDRGNA